MKKRPIPQGFGGKQPKQRTPKRADDSGHSSAHAYVLGVLSEGEVEGIVGGAQGIYFDETPAQNADGTQNFGDFSWDFRHGSEFQSHMPGYGDSVVSETGVNAEVAFNLPVTRSITNQNVDIINVRLAFQLQRQSRENGNVEGNSLDFGIQIREGGGGFVERWRQTITEKYSSLTELEYNFPVNNQGGTVSDFQVRVIRYTPTAEDEEADQKIIRWQSYTEIIETKLSYPFSALIGLRFDSTQFDAIPEMSFKLAGRTVAIPTNAQVASDRGLVFNGPWDGNFYVPALACSDPAWILWDLLTNERYGLGKYINTAALDRYSMYEISRYCNEFVPDGFGGFERRFSCNVVLEGKEDAWKVLEAFRSIFRGVIYYQGSTISFAADKPGSPEIQFNQAMILDGKIERQRTALTGRKTVAKVTWNNPEDNYKRAVETVTDDEGVALYGYRLMEMSAFACTTKGQARRAGLASLITERIEGEILTFRSNAAGVRAKPGMIAMVADTKQANIRYGGLVQLGSSASAVYLDVPLPVIEAGSKISVTLPDGTLETRDVQLSASTQSVIVPTTPFSQNPLPETDWTIGTPTVEQELVKILSANPVPESNYQAFEITGTLYRPDKFAFIEQGLDLQPRSTRRLVPVTVNPPTGATFSSIASPPTLFFAWTHPLINGRRDQYIARYEVELKKGINSWETLATTAANRYELNIELNDETTYQFRVRSIDILGNTSQWVESNTISPAKPPAPLNLRSTGTEYRLGGGELRARPLLAWDLATNYPVQYITQFEIEYSVAGLNEWIRVATTDQFLVPVPLTAGNWQYRVRIRDRWSRFSDWSNVFDFVSNPPLLNGAITFEKEELRLFNGKAEAFATFSWAFPGHESPDLINRILLYEIDYLINDGQERPWVNAYADGLKRHEIGPLEGGDYVFRVRLQDIDGEYSTYVFLNQAIAGKTAPPENVKNLRLVVTGERTAQLRWDAATDLDVRIGGEVLIHHLQSGSNPDNSSELAIVSGTADAKAVPLINGVYLAKFKDSSGFVSQQWASVTTSGVEAIQQNVIQEIVAHPQWLGDRNGFELTGNTLTATVVSGWGVIGEEWQNITDDWRVYVPEILAKPYTISPAYYQLSESLLLSEAVDVFVTADLVYSAYKTIYTPQNPLPDGAGLNVFVDGLEISSSASAGGFTTNAREITFTASTYKAFLLSGSNIDLRSPRPGAKFSFEAKLEGVTATDFSIGLKRDTTTSSQGSEWSIGGTSPANALLTPVSTDSEGWSYYEVDLSDGSMTSVFRYLSFDINGLSAGTPQVRNFAIITDIYNQYPGVESQEPATAKVYTEVKTKRNDVWSNWRPLISGQQKLGESQFRVVAESVDSSVAVLESLRITIDVPDRLISTSVRTVAGLPIRAFFSPPFVQKPIGITATIQNGQTGDHVVYENLTNKSVDVFVNDSNGNSVARDVLILAESY